MQTVQKWQLVSSPAVPMKAVQSAEEPTAREQFVESYLAGRCTTRLPVGRDRNNTRFFINAMQISRDTFCLVQWVQMIHAWLWYVKLGTDGKVTTFVQVNSLAKRLLLDKEDIRNAAEANMLPALIESYFSIEELEAENEELKREAAEKKADYANYVKALNPNVDPFQANAYERLQKERDEKAELVVKAEIEERYKAASVELPKDDKAWHATLLENVKFNKANWEAVLESIAWNSAAIKAINIAVRHFDRASKIKTHGEVLSVQHDGKSYEFLTKYENHSLSLVNSYRFATKLEERTPVYQVQDFFNNQTKILKLHQPKPNSKDGVDTGVVNEIAMLTHMHQSGPRRYQQDAPEATFDIPNYGKGYVGKFYSAGDLYAFYKSAPSVRQCLQLFMPIMEAMNEMHAGCQTFHGDLKPENLMLIRNGNDISVKIIDFESAFTPNRVEMVSASALHTREYTTVNDRQRLENSQLSYDSAPKVKMFRRKLSKNKLFHERDHEEVRRKNSLNKKIFSALEARQQFTQACEKQDVVSMGFILFGLLTGQMPYELGKDRYPKPDAIFNEKLLTDMNCSPEIISLIKDMSVMDVNARITSAEAYRRAKAIDWEAVLKQFA